MTDRPRISGDTTLRQWALEKAMQWVNAVVTSGDGLTRKMPDIMGENEIIAVAAKFERYARQGMDKDDEH